MSCKTNLCDKITKLWLFDCLDIKCPFDKLVIFSPLIHPVIASIFKSKIPPDLNFDLQRYSKKPYIFKLKKNPVEFICPLLGQNFLDNRLVVFRYNGFNILISRPQKQRGLRIFIGQTRKYVLSPFSLSSTHTVFLGFIVTWHFPFSVTHTLFIYIHVF